MFYRVVLYIWELWYLSGESIERIFMGSMTGIARRSVGGHREHSHMAFEIGQER
jgi:hypothetical protein